MKTIRVETSAVVNAPPQEVYTTLADYEHGHPAILPKPYFTNMTVMQGGQGAGTEVRTVMTVMGVERVYDQTVTEPEPGRVLLEADEASGQTTRFIVDPANDGQQAHVTIIVEFPAKPGFEGFMERLLSPPLLRRIFKQELRNLEDFLQARAVTVNPQPG